MSIVDHPPDLHLSNPKRYFSILILVWYGMVPDEKRITLFADAP